MKKHHVLSRRIVAVVLALVCSAPRRSQRAERSSTRRPATNAGRLGHRSRSTGSGRARSSRRSASVIKAFNKIYPNVKINYNPVGNNLPTVLSTAIAGGHPPDMADIAQPGYVEQLVAAGAR